MELINQPIYALSSEYAIELDVQTCNVTNDVWLDIYILCNKKRILLSYQKHHISRPGYMSKSMLFTKKQPLVSSRFSMCHSIGEALEWVAFTSSSRGYIGLFICHSIYCAFKLYYNRICC